jgi:hypothetical protein
MRPRNAVAVLVIVLSMASTWMPLALALPPLENGISFPVGTFVIPMDGKQAERILVFGFVHALLRGPNPIQLFRVVEPPDVTLSTNMTATPVAFNGGPFLIYPGDAAKVAQVKNKPNFKHVTVGVLTTQHTLNNIFRVTEPTKILVVKGEPAWGRTDITLDAMKIPYNITTHSSLAANPNMIFSYTLIVIDCEGWNGHIPSQIANNIRSHVNAGHEVIFTDRALMDLNSTFPGYVTISGAQPTDSVSNTYAYNPPRKYDPAKYGASADRFAPEYPSQYYNNPPRPNEIKVYTESRGYVVSSVPSGKVNDVRILADSKTFGTARNQYAILAFYIEYGLGVVEGLAFHPQQQRKSVVGDNGYYAVYQFYGNKFVHGPPPGRFVLEANPTSATVFQGSSATYTITVRSFGGFNLPVTLGVTGLPPGAAPTFNPPSPQPPAGGTAPSTFTVTVSTSTPIASYTLNVTGSDTSSPPRKAWVIVTLNVIAIPPDFSLSVSPSSLTINTTESKTAIVTVTSIGTFNQNVTLSVTGLPAHVTVTFTPPAPKPSPGSTASSIMRINVGADAINGTYPLTIVGSNGTCGPPCTRSTPFTLIIVKPAPPPIPWITFLLLLLAAILGITLALVAYALSGRGRPSAQRMYVVPAAAHRVRCPNCGRPIAVGAAYCPFCGRRRGSAVASDVVGYGSIPGRAFVGRRAVWGFACAMISAILILLNSAALFWASFWGAPTNWSLVFWWLGGSVGLGQSIAILIGLIAGLTVMTGGMMMVMRRGPTGAMITIPFAVLSFMIGGGFLVGGILGIVAGILGLIRR